MNEKTAIDIIQIPKYIGSDAIGPLEEKLKALGEEARVVAILRVREGIYNPQLAKLVDGVQVLLNRCISDEVYYPLKQFLNAHYGVGDIYTAFIQRFEPNEVTRTEQQPRLIE